MDEPIAIAIAVESKDVLEKLTIVSMHVDDGTLVLVTDTEVTILIHPASVFVESAVDLL